MLKVWQRWPKVVVSIGSRQSEQYSGTTGNAMLVPVS